MGFDAAATTPGEQPWVAGARVGDHVLLSRLGAGGMGEVWLAEQVETGARRAIKALRVAGDAELRLRFAREGEAQARVDAHPNVLRVHASGELHGCPYLVLELATGGDLAARLEAGPLPPLEAARLVRDLASGLAHSHARGVLHRDLKPQNVLFDEQGLPKLVDFGLARLAGADSLTNSSEVLGTPAYLAPEQATGRCDERTDVYGLGTILYQCLTGRPPFSGTSALKILQDVLHKAPPPPRSLVPEVPPPLEALCLACLAKSPEERPASAALLAAGLDDVLSGRAGPGGDRWLRGAALLALVSALAAGWALLRVGSRDQAVPVLPPVDTTSSPTSASASREDPQHPGREWPDDHTRLGPPRGGPSSGSWSELMRAELPGAAREVDLTQQLGREEEAEDLFLSSGDLSPLRRVAAQGNLRARLLVARALLQPEVQRREGLAAPQAEDEAAQALWLAVKDGVGYPPAAVLLLGLLQRGGTLGAREADPAAVDELVAWVSRREPDARWSASERLALTRLHLERGGPADLLCGLFALRSALRAGQLEERDKIPKKLAFAGGRSSAMAFAWHVARLEGWVPAAPGEQEASLLALEALRWRPLVARYLAARAFASEPTLSAEPPPPLDVLALDGGASVRREATARETHDAARLVKKKLVDESELSELRRLVRAGSAPAQWLLGGWIRTGRAEGEGADAWRALGALDNVRWGGIDPQGKVMDLDGYGQARLDAGMDLLLGRLGEVPVWPAAELLWTLQQRVHDPREPMRLLARLWLGLLMIRREWSPPLDSPRGPAEVDPVQWIREAWAHPMLRQGVQALTEPRALELLAAIPKEAIPAEAR